MLKLDGMEKIEQNADDKLMYLPSKGRLTTEREEAKRNRESKFKFFDLPKDAKIRFLPDAAGPMFTSKDYMDRYADVYAIDDNPRHIAMPLDISGSMSAKITKTGQEALSKIINDYMEQMKGMKSLYYIRPTKPVDVITLDSLSMVTESMKTYREEEDATDTLRMNILKDRDQQMATGFFYAPYIPEGLGKNEYKVVEPIGSTDTLSKEEFTADPRELSQNNLCQEINDHMINLEVSFDYPLKGKKINVGDLDICSMYDRISPVFDIEKPLNPCNEIALGKPMQGVAFDIEADLSLNENWKSWFETDKVCNFFDTETTYVPLPTHVTTGNDALDILFGGGLKPGTVTLIAGQAGLGKSALAKSVAAGLSANGTEFLYVTAEQSSEAIVERIQGLNNHNTDTGYKVVQIGDWCLNGLVNLIREETEDLANPRVVFIDELSFFKDAGSHILGRELRQLAIDLDVAIVATNGLARAGKYDITPQLPSGDFGLLAAVDVAIAITRNGNETELTNIKNRHGNTNTKFLFDVHRNLIWEPMKVVPEIKVFECTFGGQAEGRGSRVTELPSGKLMPVILPVSKRTFADLKAAFAPKVEDNYPVADWL